MVAPPRPPVTMTLPQYLVFEQGADAKHELLHGALFAISGGTRAHSLLQASVARLLGNALEARPCEVHGPDMRVAVRRGDVEHRAYPDASVVCGAPVLADDGCAIRNPVVLVEVLSASSEAHDRVTKFELYQALDSFREYLLVAQDETRIDHYGKNDDGSWTLRHATAGGQVVLRAIGVALAVDEVYSKLRDPGE
ncbi:MAG: Uma2 family endonuclease [Polyangiales bacterium]